MRKANYDKAPATGVEGEIILGWEAILAKIKAQDRPAVAVEVYPGAYEDALADIVPEIARSNVVHLALSADDVPRRLSAGVAYLPFEISYSGLSGVVLDDIPDSCL